MNALQHVTKAVDVHNPIPILQGIHIQARADGIIFTASNASMTIRAESPQDGASVTVRRTGAVVIPSRYFHDVIRKLHDERILLETNEQLIVTVKSGHSQVRLCGMDPYEFPSLSGEQSAPRRLSINSASLKSAIKQVATMASTSETRPVLTGVSVECNHDSITFIATDGVRLATRNLDAEGNISETFRAIIPAKNLYEMSKMLSSEDEITGIEVSNSRVRFATHGLKVESARIEGAFPSIMNAIPQAYLCEFTVERAHLLAAVECVTVLASDNIIKLVASHHLLKLLSRTPEVGDIENAVPLTEMSGEGFAISVNGKFLTDILRHSDCSGVRVRYAGPTSPIVILPDDPNISALFLVTPVRTHN